MIKEAIDWLEKPLGFKLEDASYSGRDGGVCETQEGIRTHGFLSQVQSWSL